MKIHTYTYTKLIAYTNSVFFYISIDPRMKMKAQRLPSGPAHSSSLSSFPHIRGLNEWNANCTSSPSIMHPAPPPPTSTWAYDSLPLSVISVRLVLAMAMREHVLFAYTNNLFKRGTPHRHACAPCCVVLFDKPHPRHLAVQCLASGAPRSVGARRTHWMTGSLR